MIWLAHDVCVNKSDLRKAARLENKVAGVDSGTKATWIPKESYSNVMLYAYLLIYILFVSVCFNENLATVRYLNRSVFFKRLDYASALCKLENAILLEKR